MPRLRSRPGSLLLEAIVSIGVFTIFLGGIGLTLMLGERSTVAGGDRVRAAFVAEQSLEAVRQMRNQDFALLAAGTHGVALTPAGAWAFSGTSIVTSDGYRSHVDVTSVGTDWLRVDSTASWNFGQARSGALVLSTYLTNWRKQYVIGNWAAATLAGQSVLSGSPDLQKVAVSGNYAFVTSSQASGGAGLYVFDVTTPATPVRVASAFNLGASAYGLAISGTGLYLATDSATEELQIFNIASPASLSLANRIAARDIPGAGRARAVTVYGDTVFVGSLEEVGQKEFHSLSVGADWSITLLDSLQLTGSVVDISLNNGYAYAATANNAAEFLVVDVFDPSNLAFAPGVGIDLDNTQDGAAMHTFGTSALIGRLSGAAIDELLLYPIDSSPVPSPPPGPWGVELAGDGLSITSVYGGKYAFVGGSGDPSELRVLDMPRFLSGLAPTVRTYNAPATIRGLFYNWQNDRLFGVTPTTLLVFQPG